MPTKPHLTIPPPQPPSPQARPTTQPAPRHYYYKFISESAFRLNEISLTNCHFPCAHAMQIHGHTRRQKHIYAGGFFFLLPLIIESRVYKRQAFHKTLAFDIILDARLRAQRSTSTSDIIIMRPPASSVLWHNL